MAGRGRGRGRGRTTQTRDNEEEERVEETQMETGESSRQPKGKKRLQKDPHLVPSKNWFGNSSVTRFVTDSMKADYDGAFMCWSDISTRMLDRWYTIFKNTCTWASEHDHLVRPEFEATVQSRINDMMLEVRNAEKAPKWLKPTHFQQIQAKKKDAAFLRRSSRGKQNRQKAADVDGVLKASHTMGSISTVDYVGRAVARNNGLLLSAPEVFHDTHTRTNSEGEREFTSQKDSELYRKLIEKKTQIESSGETIADNALYYDVAGGHKKGKVYGLGSAANLYYEPPQTSRATKSSSNVNSTYTPGIYSQLQEEQEKRRKLEERFEQFQAEMAAKFALLQSSCHGPMTPQNRDPRDPSDDGGGGSNAGVGLSACEV